MVPVFINCRDRLTDLHPLLAWLEKSGQERITLLDNDSTWPPLLEFYEKIPHEVIRLGRNLGQYALWDADLVPDEEFIWTDPDVVPVEECPLDAVSHFARILAQQDVPKVGFGLKVDDLPNSGSAIEREWWSLNRQVGPGLYRSPIDTTFALYRASASFSFDAIRTAHPYVARHLPWYREDALTDEDRHYLERASSASSWAAKR